MSFVRSLRCSTWKINRLYVTANDYGLLKKKFFFFCGTLLGAELCVLHLPQIRSWSLDPGTSGTVCPGGHGLERGDDS